MHWKLKSAVQNAVSRLPSSASYATYYWIQRRFGALRRVNPMSKLSIGVEIWRRIEGQGYDPCGKVFLEIGTGRMPLVPLAYWMMGAERTVTVDLNPYLKEELIEESLRYLARHREDVRSLFGPLLVEERFGRLLAFAEDVPFSTRALLDLCGIDYVAPADAARTGLPDRLVDFYTSCRVLEHVDSEVLPEMLKEGNRITTGDALFVHRIDYSDHFSHSDRRISSINFLQYSDDAWRRYAGNRYMYVNRLRHDDFVNLFHSAGHRILGSEPDIDERARRLLAEGALRLDGRFRAKPKQVLSISGAWIVSKKRG